MISLHLTRGENYEGVCLRLPATPEEVGEAYAMLDTISRYAGKTHIVDVKSPVKNLAQFIKGADLAKQEELEKLNRLAERIGCMNASEQVMLSGALCTESINGLDDVLRVADRLEDYEIIPEVTCDRELGSYVVEHGIIMDFPEAVRPYLDYVGIGAEYYADHGGAYTMDGYVKRRDGQPEQAPEHTVFSAYLRSHCGAKRLLFYFPAAEEALENAKQRLQIDSFAEADIESLVCDIPYLADLLPTACISVEDINELALAVEEMQQTDGETLKYLSVLSVEQPEDFPAALRLAVDLDDYRLLPSEPSHVVIAGGMQMDGDWITEWGSTGQPYLGIMCEENGAEDVWTLVGVTNTDSIQLDYNTEEMVTRYGSKYIAAAMALCKAYLDAKTQDQFITAADASYYLELAAGETFRNMNLDRQISLLVEYEDLLHDYTLISRETEDGKTAYIVGQYNGNPTTSPLYGMYSVDLGKGEEWDQFLYREEASVEVEEVLSGNKKEMPPSAGYRITDSKISWSSDSGLILIQPKDTELSLDVAWSRYLYTPNGREYIADAVSRGIDVCGRTDTFLYVYRISERFGEIAERVALTEAEAAAILAEDRVKITEGFGFSASLHIDDQTTYFNEREGIPQTVLNLAVDRCDYRFGDPSNITDTIREARLDCDWLDTPLYARGEDLSRLREILKNAEQGYVGACGYGAKLTLTFSGGEMLTVFKGCDGCDTVVFGSYGGYFIGDKENSEFWEMFGLDPVTKAPIEANSNGRELLYKDEEILITVPEKYAHLVKMDGLYSDEQYTNKANFYYEPEYFEHRGYAAPLNGGWMLTISTTLPSFAENTWAGHNSTYWTKDGTRVYVEQRPTDSFNCTEANLAEFKAVMNSIRVEYIGLEPFAVGISLPTEQLSAAEHSAAVDAIFTNLKTGWWNGEALKSCVHESAAFECLYRKADANISRLYGYGGYFRWGRDETCVEYWYAPTIVTLDTDTQQVLDLWWPGDGAAYESSILNQFPEAIASTVAEPNSGRYAAVRARLMEASKEFMVDSSPLSVPGATRRFGVQDLRLEITNVLSTHKTSVLAEGIELHEYVVVSCTPESKITVLDAGMSDPSYSEDGKPHPKWGLSYTNKSDRTRITDETKTVPVTADLEGIYNLEASLFVIRLNLVD